MVIQTANLTATQQRKLDVILGKLESLQHEVKDETGLLREAKDALIRFRRESRG